MPKQNIGVNPTVLTFQEIDMQKKEVEALEEETAALDAEVKALLVDPKTNIRRQLFPQLFPSQSK